MKLTTKQKDIINIIETKYPKHLNQMLKKMEPDIYNIINSCEWDTKTFSEKCYIMIYDVWLCNECNKKTNFINFKSGFNKYCSTKCSKKTISKETRDKIGKASAQKFIDNPSLRGICAINGTKAMNQINSDGRAFRMSKGYHTEEHKRYMKELMTGRDVTWNDKIKENHWSTTEQRDEIIKQINESKQNSEKWNSEERRYILADWSVNNPSSLGSKFNTGYYLNNTTKEQEWYDSGFELEYMIKFNEDVTITHWTKKHKIYINYEDVNNKQRRYYPDFLVTYNDGTKKLIETKGWIKDKENLKLKNNAAELYCDENNLIFEIIYQNGNKKN